jgi:uncharacterized protein (DUF169 family)
MNTKKAHKLSSDKTRVKVAAKYSKQRNKFEAEAKKIVETLGLKRTPIAGKFSQKPNEIGDTSRKLAICAALDVVKREDEVLTLSKENVDCFGGKHFMGFEILPIEKLTPAVTAEKHKVYESTGAALASIRKQPQPVKRGNYFTIGPLEKFETDPDLIFLFVNPAQADKMLGLASFRGAEPFIYYPASSICSTITYTLAKNQPQINLIASFDRGGGKWDPDEMILALPFKHFEEALENTAKSGYTSFGN